MTDITRSIYEELDGQHLQAIAAQLGIAPDQADAAVRQALPVLIAGLADNAQSPQGAGDLYSALQRDHSGVDLGGLLGGLLGGGGGRSAGMGGLGDLLGSVLGGGSPAPRGGNAGGGLGDMGGAILGHIFGNRQGRASDSLGQASGIGGENAGRLMAMLAPLVMAALARLVQNRGMAANDLGKALGQEQRQIENAGGGGLLNAVLDRNGDGRIDASEMLQAGISAINMFGRRA